MADCFPGNLVDEGSSSILFINILVPIVSAPGAHVCLQIIFLLKAKEQKPKPSLNWKITSSKLIYRKFNTLSYIIPKNMKTTQGNCFLCAIFCQENSEEETFFAFTASQYESYVPRCQNPQGTQKYRTLIADSMFTQPKLWQSSAWACSCRHRGERSHCTTRPHRSWCSPQSVLSHWLSFIQQPLVRYLLPCTAASEHSYFNPSFFLSIKSKVVFDSSNRLI